MPAPKHNSIEFTGAEIKKLGVKKLVSLDKEYELVLRTADQAILAADTYDSNVTFKVTLEAESS